MSEAAPAAPTWRGRFRRLSRTTKAIIFLLLSVNVAVILAFVILGKSRINEFFNHLGRELREMGLPGALIVGLAVVLTSHPPMLGFSASMTLIGYAWGIWPGFLIGGIAAELGGIIAWFSVRTFFLSWMRTEGSRKNKHWEAFGHVMSERGLPLVVMVRWCPLPFGFGNGLFAAVDGVNFWQYLIANLSFLPRLFIPVFIGSRFRSLGDSSPDPRLFWINLVSIGIALACGLTTGILVYRRTLARMQALDQPRAHGEGEMAAEVLEGAVHGYGAVDESEPLRSDSPSV